MSKPLPTLDRLAEVLDYAPETGAFRWKVRCGRQAAGKPAGCLCKKTGYVLISVDGTLLGAHRIAWFISHGSWSVGDIDHRDLNPANNSICNLRLASRAQNNANAPLKRNNTSGHKGVVWDKANKKWTAQIMRDRKTTKLGRFILIEDAVAAYAEAAKATWGEFVRV